MSAQQDWHGPPGDGHRDSAAAQSRTRADTTGGKSGRPDEGRPTFEPRFMQDETWGREMRALDLERERQDREDEQRDPTYAVRDTSGGTDA